MSVTQEDLNEFQRFAETKLQNGGAESLDELVALWHDARRHEASVAALRESHQDAELGRVVPATEVFLDARKALDHLE